MANNKIEVFQTTSVVMPHRISEARLELSAKQFDIFAIILALVFMQTDVDDNLEYSITGEDLNRLFSYENSKQGYAELSRICKETGQQLVEGRHIGWKIKHDNEKVDYINLFSSVAYTRGRALFVLTPEAKKELVYEKQNMNMAIFSSLKYILPLKSMYSKHLYFLCKQYSTSGVRYCDTNWSEFIDKLGIPTTYNYNKIKKNVLDKTREDINTNTDIEIDYEIQEEFVSGGRRPLGIRFFIVRKSS